MNEDRLLTAHAEDLISRCNSQDIPVCSEFLDARQQSLLRAKFGTKQGDVTIVYSGGYDEADRVVMVCLPYYLADAIYISSKENSSDHCNSDHSNSDHGNSDYGSMADSESSSANGNKGDASSQPSYIEDILTVIRAEVPKNSQASKSGRPLTHGDYLGALMGLGVRRSVIGDILVSENGADIIVLKEMADYLLQNLVSAGKASITASEIELSELRVPETERKEFSDTVASLRLDAVLASAFRLSRGKAAEAINQGLVFVDHLQATRTDMVVSEGAELVIRHLGKAKLTEVGKRTRKDRIRITIER